VLTHQGEKGLEEGSVAGAGVEQGSGGKQSAFDRGGQLPASGLLLLQPGVLLPQLLGFVCVYILMLGLALSGAIQRLCGRLSQFIGEKMWSPHLGLADRQIRLRRVGKSHKRDSGSSRVEDSCTSGQTTIDHSSYLILRPVFCIVIKHFLCEIYLL
jgi:hypothetical protein